MEVDTYIDRNICTYSHANIILHQHMYIGLSISIYIYIYVYVYIYICLHRQTCA